ncbi:fructosamine kinase family protein [Solitalea canadensis]|uniref:Fructosamine-3-kinase n=1 Tax=Solitalea canadensis (strain ATCC 29591 / DSM 3403 / JCM 21819 / LMG 8368 / NBRC 15130 / NCIMB 12057 / USAM 9D) TaxID=929556 RepID=H8KQW4_SOLCM|nr:fructosamine kinase family protein [Solitalea canadensis]AFD07110.1 fructosamine-3-kinase [Solitalea canadensis DSM 3403]
MKTTLQQALSQVLNADVIIDDFHLVEGGSISSAAKVVTNSGTFFIKWNDASFHKLFEAEEIGLNVLRTACPILVPKLIGSGVIDYTAFLILEWIEPHAPEETFWEDFAKQLAIIHSNTTTLHGLAYTNFIGSLPQYNHHYTNWVDFFVANRLQVLVEAAFNKGYLTNSHLKKFYGFYSKLYTLIPEEKPSLLHGDLWNGNMMCGSDGKARIFDPAIYYGNREMDLAMSALFGGFNSKFYKAYDEYYPLEKGYESRFPIHNLYPLLVHLNLFGMSYLTDIEAILKEYN